MCEFLNCYLGNKVNWSYVLVSPKPYVNMPTNAPFRLLQIVTAARSLTSTWATRLLLMYACQPVNPS